MSTVSHKYVVAFGGRRDYYQVAAALASDGRLERLVTDIYCPDVIARSARFLPDVVRRRVLRRRSPGISSDLVLLPFAAVLLSSKPGRQLSRWSHGFTLSSTLGRRAARRAVTKGCGAVIYGYNWESFIDIAARYAFSGARLIFLSEPLPSQLRAALRADRLRTGNEDGKMAVETLTELEVQRREVAFLKADGAIVPSSYVRDGLLSRGMAPERVRVVPYGGDLTVRLDGRREPSVSISAERQPAGLRLLWVGQLTYLKAPHHLAAALKALGRTDVSLTIVAYRHGTVDPFADVPCRVRWVPRADSADLLSLFQTHDVLVMPTLAEAFGLVYVEALHAGLPVIATRSSGGPDVISEGKNGLLIDAGSPDSLARAIRELADNPGLVASLKDDALATGRYWTWNRFRSSVITAISDLENLPRTRVS
jgi:glycosyltransferase involved in cell wall biosynthesis